MAPLSDDQVNSMVKDPRLRRLVKGCNNDPSAVQNAEAVERDMEDMKKIIEDMATKTQVEEVDKKIETLNQQMRKFINAAGGSNANEEAP